MSNNALVYISYDTLGNFYIGKSTVQRLAEGYQGSGVRISAALKLRPFITMVLVDNLTCRQAYSLEGILVTKDTIALSGCLNLSVGGAFRPEDNIDYSTSRGAKISASRKKRFATDPAFRKAHMTYVIKASQASHSTSYTIDGLEVLDLTSTTFPQFKKDKANARFTLKKVGWKSYNLIDDGWYVDGIRTTRKPASLRIIWAGRIGTTRPKFKVGPKPKVSHIPVGTAK